jgi:hypothetical protein
MNTLRVPPSIPRHNFTVLLVNRIGTFRTPNVIIILPCITRFLHWFFVSLPLRRGSTFQSRSSIVRKATASVVANLFPMHWRGPKCESEMRQKVAKNKPMLNAENSTSGEVPAPYHRDGLYSLGSGKYRGLFSIYHRIRQFKNLKERS